MGYIPKVGEECLCLQWSHVESVIARYVNKGFVVYQVNNGSEHVDNIEFFKPIKTQAEIDEQIKNAELTVIKAFKGSQDKADYSAVIQVLIEAGYHNGKKVNPLSYPSFVYWGAFGDQELAYRNLVAENFIIAEGE